MNKLWNGRFDSDESVDLRLWQVIKDFSADITAEKGVCFVGYDTDDGVMRNQGRVGAAQGSNAIRKAMQSYPVVQGISLYDAGNLHDTKLEAAQLEYSEKIAAALKANLLPIGLGGGHDIAYASYLGVRKNFPDKKIGIINFDAHLDNRPYDQQPTSGTSFKQILDTDKHASYVIVGYQDIANTQRLRDAAQELGMQIIDEEESCEQMVAKLQQFISDVDVVYVTFCMDVFDITEAPGVSAPMAIGLDKRKALSVLRSIIDSKKLRCLDFAEVNPGLDIDDRTARLVGKLIYETLRSI